MKKVKEKIKDKEQEKENQILNRKINSNSRELLAASMSSDIADALSASVENLDILDYEFRKSLLCVINKVLKKVFNNNQKVMIFYEVVPGFTLICLRKNLVEDLDHTETVEENHGIVSSMIDAFFQKTGNKTLSIENDDVLLVFFPVSDIQKNLKELGFYYIS